MCINTRIARNYTSHSIAGAPYLLYANRRAVASMKVLVFFGGDLKGLAFEIK